jgi:hypothetical protein
MGTRFNAIPEAVLAQRAAAVESDPGLLSGYSEVSLGDPATRAAMLYYALLERRPDLLADLLADLGLSGDELFWNRYYWFLRLKRLHELAEHSGQECGPMAQQAFDMLPDCGDYEPYPEVKALARRDAEAHFRRVGPGRKEGREKP